MSSNLSLATDVALVTGASRGIGQAIAQALAQAGARVVGTATSEVGAQAISAALGERGRGAVYNATDTSGVETLLADMEAHEGLPTILVNNAGIAKDALLLRMKYEDWDQTIDLLKKYRDLKTDQPWTTFHTNEFVAGK